jgi:hypothetical protein
VKKSLHALLPLGPINNSKKKLKTLKKLYNCHKEARSQLKLKRAPCAVGVQGGEEMSETAPTEAPILTMGRCQIKKLHKFG